MGQRPFFLAFFFGLFFFKKVVYNFLNIFVPVLLVQGLIGIKSTLRSICMANRHILRDQRGFTLIEIIAVLVLIGILAAVAVPKYMDMQVEAQDAAVAGALGAAASNVQLQHAKLLASNAVSTDAAVAAACSTAIGDFTASYAAGGGGVTITLTAGPSWFATSAATKTKTVILR